MEKVLDSKTFWFDRTNVHQIQGEWEKIIFSTEKTNRSEAEKSVLNLYTRLGREKPKNIIWCDGPASMNLIQKIIIAGYHIGGPFRSFFNIHHNVLRKVKDDYLAILNRFTNTPIKDIFQGFEISYYESESRTLALLIESAWEEILKCLYQEGMKTDCIKYVVSSLLPEGIDNFSGVIKNGEIFYNRQIDRANDACNTVSESVGNIKNCHIFFGPEFFLEKQSYHYNIMVSSRVASSWAIALDYFSKVFNLHDLGVIFPSSMLIKDCFSLIMFAECALVCERPSNICRERGLLHSETGPAIEFPDGTEYYCYKGVNVPKDVAISSGKDLDPKLLLATKNSEVRKVIINKIGMDRICTELENKVMDSSNGYELISFKWEDDEYRPYLKMKNRTTGLIHVEGVPPYITTVKEALIWRNNGLLNEPLSLT